ncbi:MAG: DNA polymerase III subunit delta [Actinomycetota bacterium]|nr:DNA polymerase III subunit delta [Actinomycetota bacterium]
MSGELSDLKPAYLIFGEQEVLLERALTRLKKRVAEAGGSEFDVDMLDAETADASTVVASANMLPLMAERRLVVVRHIDRYPTGELGILAEYCGDPNPSTTLVLVAKKMAKNLKIYKAVDALGGIHEYRPPSKAKYPQTVVQLFADRGRQAGLDGAELLVRAVGYDLRRLEAEIEKVIAYVGDRTTVSRADIEGVMSTTAPTSIWEYLDAIGTRDCRAALMLLGGLIADNESVHGIHAMSVRHLRNLISVRAYIDRPDGSRAPGVVARAVGNGMQEWTAKNFIRQAERFTVGELTRALRSAASAEADMKTSRDPRLAHERWLVDTCVRPEKSRSAP